VPTTVVRVRISPLSANLHPVIIMASMCACLLLLLLLPTDEELPLVLYSRSCSFFLRLKIAQQKLCFLLPPHSVCLSLGICFVTLHGGDDVLHSSGWAARLGRNLLVTHPPYISFIVRAAAVEHRSAWSVRASPPALRMCPCTGNLG
jgi:hypothetical protein